MSSYDFSNIKVFVFGDLILDHYWFGVINRISREAPVPIVLQKNSTFNLGGAANVAHNVKALGANPYLFGFIGKDNTATDLTNLCNELSIDHHFVENDSMLTTRKLRVVSQGQHLLRIDFEEPDRFKVDVDQVWSEIENQVKRQLLNSDIVVLSDYGLGGRVFFSRIIKLARELNKFVIIDPKGNHDFSAYKHASIITPNLSELIQIAKALDIDLQELETAEQKVALSIIEKLDLEYLLITKSEKGMTLYYKDCRIYHQNTFAEEVFDVTGAGDTVIATLAVALADNYSIERACYLSNKAAGISVSKMGTATVSPKELRLSCEHYDTDITSHLELKQLLEKVKQAKEKGEVVVFTNGCFDILHRGHLICLKKARQLGDRLIVGVNSDDSVRRLKGPTRPVNTVDDRILFLNSLKDVDWVIEFNEDTPLNLIKAIMPNILVKGDDYTIDQIPGAKEVLENGGQVKTIKLVENYSTTNIINKIKN